jgi:hypothetical protein
MKILFLSFYNIIEMNINLLVNNIRNQFKPINNNKSKSKNYYNTRKSLIKKVHDY